MKNYLNTLESCALFREISPHDLSNLLTCLDVSIKSYEAHQIAFTQGTQVNHIGIVLEGRLEIIKENLCGNRTLISFITPANLFAEGIVCTSHRIAPVSVYASTNTTVLFIPYTKIIKSCTNSCAFHIQLIHNMLSILGNKNYILNTKLDYLMIKGIQPKIITYLLQETKKRDSLSFELSLNRNELADFLNVSRPSMCRELAALKAEGLLDYYKNSFKLIDIESLKQKLY